MRESIYTIPINDVFRDSEGCPVCRMKKILEKQCVEFITGAAMMEPDVRMETNRHGFCAGHLELLSHQKNRLSVALMLETRLAELMARQFSPQRKKGGPGLTDTCFVCREIEQAGGKLLSTVLRLWQSDPSFRETVRTREYYCLRDYAWLCQTAEKELGKKASARFIADITEPTRLYMEKLRTDIHDFSLMFDYRNAHRQPEREEVKSAIEQIKDFFK